MREHLLLQVQDTVGDLKKEVKLQKKNLMFYTSLRNLLAFQIVASQFLSKFELNFRLICFLGKVAGFCILRIVKNYSF